MTKLGFLGAMNRDLVAAASGAQVLTQLGLEAVPLLETSVSDALAAAGAQVLGQMGAQSYLGGSAFNAARVVGLLNQLGPRVEAEFIGIAGQVEGEHPHIEALANWGIGHTSVTASEGAPATCLAMVEPSGRTLLTALGVNAGIAQFLRDERERVVAAIARCDVVHVTSFLDADVPGLLAEIVREAKLRNGALRLSLDPGAAWVVPGGEGFAALMAQTDILHVNHEELDHLTRGGAVPIEQVGAKLAHEWMIVSRHHDYVEVIWQQKGGAMQKQALPRVALPEHVVDATGAGDTFCGSFLWALLNGAQAIESAQLAFNAARAKVQMAGPVNSAVLAQILRALRV